MKKLLIGSAGAAALALALSLSATTPASAASASELCKSVSDLGLPSHGACVSLINKGLVVDGCKNFLATDPVGYEAVFGDTQLGSCVSTLRHLIKDL